MADGDNELLVDSKSRLSLLAFAATVKNRAAVVLKEFLVDDTGLVADEKGRPFANQIIASLIKTEAVYKSSYSKSSNTNVKRRFEPGSEWLYYKFYCGSKSSDKILTDMVLPLAEKWQQEKIIDKWFFIRYHDPGFHLRVRFHLADSSNTDRILKEITAATEKHGWNAFITRTQLDTYHRELERYGPDCIEMAESLSHTDSLNTLRFLQNTEGDERENTRWLWGIAMTDSLLNAFEFTEKQKQLLTHQLSCNFSKEFKAGKNLFLQINKKYNRNRDKIYNILTGNNDCGIEGSDFIKAEVAVFRKQIRPVCLKIRNLLKDKQQTGLFLNIAGSYVHMSLNRLFPVQARLHEYILYEFLNRYYTTAIFVRKQQSSPQHPTYYQIPLNT
jgi:thiopeptide-type bacteriocin biosynthesis protein